MSVYECMSMRVYECVSVYVCISFCNSDRPSHSVHPHNMTSSNNVLE